MRAARTLGARTVPARLTAGANGLRGCRDSSSCALWGWGLGESAEEEAAVGGPYEPFGDDGVAFIVNLEAAMVHQPRPGAFHDPTLRQDLETSGMDLRDDLDRQVVAAAVINEAALEPRVAPQLREPPRAGPGPIRDDDTAGVVRRAGRHHGDRHQQAQRVHDPERLAARDLLARVVTPGRGRDRRRAPHAAGVDDPGGRFRIAALGSADCCNEPGSDRF